ncbi:MAG: NifB/NifX family molybdenum-iron cluster-binding protein [Candidatus Bathyarchaeota archaeon]|nr:NifB/NifX family molybdenum-iron cluster-binding protein [Candidatus Bathyarchaeota archaeon]
MKFRCYNCSKEWVIPKEKLVYISDWPDTCPNCRSADIGHETVEKAMASFVVVLENVNDKELEEIKRKKLEKMLQGVKKGGEKITARIVVPVLDESGLNARLSEHFGRAPYFAVIDLDENGSISSQKTVSNISEHFGGTGLPPDRILQLRPNALITYGMGPRALAIFQNARVAVLRANANTVKDVILAYNNDELEELTEGCHHARHR